MNPCFFKQTCGFRPVYSVVFDARTVFLKKNGPCSVTPQKPFLRIHYRHNKYFEGLTCIRAEDTYATLIGVMPTGSIRTLSLMLFFYGKLHYVSFLFRVRRKGPEMYYFDQVKFGKRLAAVRKAHGLYQQELADLVGVEKTRISRIERGANACSVDLLVILACALKVSTDFLLGIENQVADEKEFLMNTGARLIEMAESMEKDCSDGKLFQRQNKFITANIYIKGEMNNEPYRGS